MLNVINITSQPDTNGSGIVELSWMTPFTDNATFDIMYSVQRGSDSRMDTTSSNSVVLTKLIPSVLNRMSINYNVNIKATYSNGLVSGMESHTFTTGALSEYLHRIATCTTINSLVSTITSIICHTNES